MADIFDKYRHLFVPGEDGESELFSEEEWNDKALRKEIKIEGIRRVHMHIILECMKSSVRWHEDIHKAQSIEGDYEEMARYFSKSISKKLKLPKNWSDLTEAAFSKYPFDESVRKYRDQNGEIMETRERDRLIDEELNIEIPLSLNASEIDYLIGALRGEMDLQVDGQGEERRALTFWTREQEVMAQELANALEPRRDTAKEDGCQSLYEFLC